MCVCVEDLVCLENTTIKFGFCYTSKLDLFPPRGEAARGCFESRRQYSQTSELLLKFENYVSKWEQDNLLRIKGIDSILH